MRARATNAVMRASRDEAAIIMGIQSKSCSGHLETRSAQTLSERWRQMTDWLAQDGSARIILGETRTGIDSADPCFNEVLLEIEQFTALQPDWNDEGAPAIDRAVIIHVRKFVNYLDCLLIENNITGDRAPAVFPTIDGGVRLYWKLDGRQFALTFHPGANGIDAMEKFADTQATHRMVTEDEAGAIAIEVMRPSA